MDKTATDRRSFLKTGALVAAPVIAAAPAAALAADDSRARLARLEDERAIEALNRALIRQVNAGAPDLGGDVRSIAEDTGRDADLTLAEDGLSATARRHCRVERETGFTGDSTLERMARFQGQGSHRQEERRVLATEYVKDHAGWRIAGARLV